MYNFLNRNSHYSISTTFNNFDSSLITRRGSLYLYAGLPVHDDNLQYGRLVNEGTRFNGQSLNEAQAISLWQQVYFSTRISLDSEPLVQTYREVHGICHACCGDGTVTLYPKDDTGQRLPVQVECRACKGTGLLQDSADQDYDLD